MNKKEIGEIRRRMRRDRTNMRAIYGCYVRDNKEIISEFKASLALLPENEAEKYMALFKKTLGGSLGKTLNDISFTTRQVANREAKYDALAKLRECRLEDTGRIHSFYQKVIEALSLDYNYVILLGCDTYDVPFKSKDDEAQSDASDESFTYFVCAICPVKETKPNLHYVHDEATFHDGGMMQAVSSPIAGFMFPSFDNRSTNLYGALYFNKDTSDSREALVDAIFGTEAPMPADDVKRSFDSILHNSLQEECTIDVVQAIHDRACMLEQLHKETKSKEPLVVDKGDLEETLASAGVSTEKVNAFRKAFDETFGHDADVGLLNIVDTKHYTVKTEDAVIKVAPDRAQNVEMRTIGGLNYIMILADDCVEVNGIQLGKLNHD